MTERALAIIGGVLIVYHVCFTTAYIESGSMSPALQGEDAQTGDWILIDRLSYLVRDPDRWEVVAFRREGLWVAKRVVAFPGEDVAIRDGQVLTDGHWRRPPESLASLQLPPESD